MLYSYLRACSFKLLIIAHNFRQLARFFKEDIRKKVIEKLSASKQGIPVSI
ncbi:hypothetical protein DSOL_4655 [Desulfosporosinus metallidurans]|uniref:Uncharacterized protein n=1 Tax=Desulfosporosinus metallidurans TaxID=1888891 RepID=A0A1Q8QIR6_9FIRM|nr:hypothetical protein DSOL_4655 [Desulfosporosinus metallidurans]